jgi:hypothetical protein
MPLAAEAHLAETLATFDINIKQSKLSEISRLAQEGRQFPKGERQNFNPL